MRAWLAVLLLASLALAGCTLPDEEPRDPLLGVCPQWIPGPWNHVVSLELVQNDTSIVLTPEDSSGALHEFRGFPVDRYVVTFEDATVTGGNLEMFAFANSTGRSRGILDSRTVPATNPTSLVFSDGAAVVDHPFAVHLSAVAHGADSAPDDLRLRFVTHDGATASVRINVTAHYRVCGAPL